MSKRKHRFRALWGAPLVIGLLSLIGLVSALAGDGLADWLSWLGLAVPVATVIWAMRRRRA